MIIKDVMPSFELFQPTQLRDAFALLDRFGKDSWKMAGGYDSLSWFKERAKKPKAVIDLSGIAEMKVTAPLPFIRNARARPDDWEGEVIRDKLLSPAWPKDQSFVAVLQTKGRPAHRTAVPEYYGRSCLTCHGSPKGEIDITGYPKEGGNEGDLGGVISITLYR